VIKATQLTKFFGGRAAVDGITFEIPRGQVVGFLGPNGAGKTTTMRLLTGFLPADEGAAEIAGLDVGREPLAARRRLGYLPEDNPLREEFEVTDTLEFAARLRGLRDDGARRGSIRAALKSCGLRPAIGKKVGELSKGFRQRLGLAQAILHDPEVLILDEPTSGLDPNQVVEVRELIARLGERKTVLISTHLLAEVQAACARAIIICDGKIAADGAPAELSSGGKERLFVELKAPRAQAREALGALPAAKVSDAGAGFHLESAGGEDLREALFALAVERRWPILELKRDKPDLEAVFRRLTHGT
jgi:ABC-2 type transport system ATP-binding protein